MASVGDVGECSHDHDRDDHGATEEGNVRMTVHERWAYESADPIDSIQTLETIGIRWLDFYPFSRDKNEGPVIVMKESPVAGSLLSSLDVGDAAPSMHPNA